MPLGVRLVEQVGRPFNGHWLARGLLGGLVVVFAGEVVTLPFAAWRQSVLRRYGLSTQGWSGWTVDLLKGFAVGAVIGAVAAQRVKMTAIPQMVALFNGVGGGAASLIAASEYHVAAGAGVTSLDGKIGVSIMFSAVVGAISFAGSLVGMRIE